MAAIPTTSLATDSRGLESLRRNAAQDPKAAVRDAAKQFESLFMNELLKSMRSASMSSGMMDNESTKLGTEMLDAQLANKVSGQPGGLADIIARQLERQMGLSPGPIPSAKPANTSLPLVSQPNSTPKIPEKSAAGFVQQHTQAAQAAEAQTGIPAAFMIAQSAHETGWGKKEIIGRDGTNSNNLFGIKAGANWTGATVDVTTTEYVGGRPQKMVQKFRAYASHAESFADYAKLMKDSPRYQNVVASGADAKGFAQGLQKAGYATDPAYADKLGRVINTTLRLQRGLA
ncbi:flagellar assembly peptidoglycan hydrolase FlgJ [Aquabacterium sp.]|uniref:flagellar assembly peptidoglycan hydrolase FlgJ n=1 Tax=Aquabacterium sp. TaxID=1872578 RepID=UPI002BFECE0B|nr:flagellar assembly peptidoglycan hydrolase FlgJ [Aquabacterium sp.]HSW07526.1 flagellar assembly peptidoglycan hydrolase FlgJ [Aquabacterium sp.]